MASGGFASSANFANLAGSGTVLANAIFITKVILNSAATISAVLININTAVSSVQFKAVIYDGSHSALLATGSIVTSVAAGYNRLPLAANVSLAAGTYYVGHICNTNVVVTLGVLSGAAWNVTGQSLSSPANPLVGGAVNGNAVAVALEFDGTTAQSYGWGADYSSGVTLSVSNTVGTVPAPGSGLFASLRGVLTHSAPAGGGKFYFEIVPSVTASADTVIGIASALVNMANVGGATASASYIELLRSDGAIVGVVTPASPLLSYVGGDVIGVAYDAGAGLAWLNKNNGTWQGNGAGSPSSGTNGLSIAPGNWPMMPFAARINGVASFTLRDYLAAQQYTAPSGFSPWSPYVAPVINANGPIVTMIG